MPINLFQDRVKQVVPTPSGAIGVGSVIPMGPAFSAAHRTYLSAYGATKPATFVLTDSAGRALSGVWTVNADNTCTVIKVLGNDRIPGAPTETFSSTCLAYNVMPAAMSNSPLWGWELISQASFTGQSNVAIELDPAYTQFRLEGLRIAATSNAIISLRISTNAGVSYDSGASDYTFTGTLSTAGTGTFPAASASQIELTPLTLGNDPRVKFDALFDVGAASRAFNIQWESSAFNSSSALFKQSSGGTRNTAGLVTHLLIFPSAGTFAGVLNLHGLK